MSQNAVMQWSEEKGIACWALIQGNMKMGPCPSTTVLMWAVMLQGHGMGVSYLWSYSKTYCGPFLLRCLVELFPAVFSIHLSHGAGLVVVGVVWGEPRAKREHLP